MTTIFLRLLKFDEKEAALTSIVNSLYSGTGNPDILFQVDPAKFSKVPNSPFAYWVGDEIRELFTKFPPFEGEGRTVRVGLQTSDDFRFVRAWWEVPAEHRLDAGNGPDWREDLPAFQAWCRKRTNEGKYWVPFAKGGEYSPYYADIHLVVNWKGEGEEMKAFSGSVIRNEDYYFRPGVFQTLRADELAPHITPAGCIFGHNGFQLFGGSFDLLDFTLLLNAPSYRQLYKMQLGRDGYALFIAGILQQCPYLKISNQNYLIKVKEYCNIYSRLLSSLIISRYHIPIKRTDFYSRYELAIEKYSKLCSIAEDDFQNRFKISRLLEDSTDFSVNRITKAFNENGIVYDLFSDIVGIVFGFLDIRIFKNSDIFFDRDILDPLPVCPPAMLVGTDGLPARPDNIASEAWLRARPNASSLPPEPFRSQKITASEYPLEIPWDGILVDDPEDSRDILARLRAVLSYLYGTDADAKERELCSELAVRDLREYLRKPSLFFNAHLKRYSKSRRKAPIYWPLQTRDGRYTLWLYYPRLTADTLYGCINILEAKIRLEQRKLELARIDLEKSEGKAERTRVEELTEFIAALTEMKEELERVAALPYKPNLDDGVQITAAPLWRLFRLTSLQKELKVTWEKLENGDYDWAHLAYSIWPDRVREKCRNDRSLAIAHGLENICEQKPLTDKDEKKKRGRKAKPAFEPDEELEYDED
jgi:hypothetical protein